MAKKPPHIRSISTRPKFNMLVYAEPGVGKTPFIAGSERALILDSDAGLDSAAIAGSDADVWTVEDHVMLFEVLEYLQHEDHGYKWIWWDGITLYQEKGLEAVMLDLIAGDPDIGKPGKPHRDVDLPDRGEYRLNYGRILRFVRHMSALPVNFGITAHVMVDEEYDLHVPLIAGHGKNGPQWSKVCGYMGVVGYLRHAKSKERGRHWVLHCERNFKDYYAKDRYGVLGTMREPTIPAIEAAVLAAMPARPKHRKARKKTTTRRAKPMT